MHGKDKRMRNIDEMMNGIKTIKYNGYENFFDKKVIPILDKIISEIIIKFFSPPQDPR